MNMEEIDKGFTMINMQEIDERSAEMTFYEITAPMYQMIADVNELKWFFDHVIQKPQVNESYSMVFVCRHKKLTAEEKEILGLTRKESEFLSTQTVRLGKFKDALDIDEDGNWTFDNFLKRVKHFNVDQGAYTTSLGGPLPQKTLAIIFYVNPCDDIKVADRLVEQIESVKTAIVKAMLNGKTTTDNLQSYQLFGNLENNLKHFKANCKGSSYWLDYDLDVPEWFKEKYYAGLTYIIERYYNKGDYVVIGTSGGYHILCRTNAIHFDPHLLCKDITQYYVNAIEAHGESPYVDDKGNSKFECIVNDSQIPGLPLPGTYQYGKPVTVLNKGDFE